MSHSHESMRPKSATALQEAEMMNTMSRQAQITKDPLEKIRMLALCLGADGIMCIGRFFRCIDEDGNKQLDRDEFVRGLQETGLEISENEANQVFDLFDTDGSGKINMDEFLFQLRPPMSENRYKIIEKAFNKLDRSGDGKITIEAIKRVYNVRSNPLYQSGEISEDAIQNTFLGHFEKNAAKFGIITKDDFVNYYSGVSTSIDNDCYFDLMMRQAYKL